MYTDNPSLINSLWDDYNKNQTNFWVERSSDSYSGMYIYIYI